MSLSKDPVKRARQLANLEKGKWKKGDVPNPKGRPRKSFLAPFIEKCENELGMDIPKPNDVAKTYLYCAALGEEYCKKVVEDKSQPMFIRIIAKEVLSKKGIDILEKMCNRAYGTQQKLDITTNGKDVKADPLIIRFVANKEQLAETEGEVRDIDNDREEGETQE